MKRIVIDYLRRWKWVLGSGFLLHAALMTIAWQTADNIIPLAVLMGSAFVLMFEFFRTGGARTYLSFPVTSRDLARAWRFVALEFPAIYFLVALAISALAGWLIEPTHLLNFERFLILAIFQVLILGTVFYALTGLPHSPPDQRNFIEVVIAGFHGLLWGFSIPGFIYLAQGIPERLADFKSWHWAIGICLAIITAGGWFRAELLVLKRAQQIVPARPGTPGDQVRSSRSAADRMRGFGGIPFHCVHYMRTTGLLGLAIISINWLWMYFVAFRRANVNGVQDYQFTASQINFVVPIMAALTGIMALVQLRSLRSLPLSRKQISGLLVLWPMAFGAIFGFVAVLVHKQFFGGPYLWEYFGLSMVAASVLMFAVPALLRFGFTFKAFIVLFVLFPGVQVFQMFDNEWRASLRYLWLVILVLVPIAFALCVRLLDTGYPWRAGVMKVKGMMRS